MTRPDTALPDLVERLLPHSDVPRALIDALIRCTETPGAGQSLLAALEASIAKGQFRVEILGIYLLTAKRARIRARLELASPLHWTSGLHWLFPLCRPEELREISAYLIRGFPEFKFLATLHAIVSAVPQSTEPPRFRDDPAAIVQFVPSSRPETRHLLVCYCGMGGSPGIPLGFFDCWLESLPVHVLYLRSDTVDRYGEDIVGLGNSGAEVTGRIRALADALNVEEIVTLGASGGGLPSILTGCRVGAIRMAALGARLTGADAQLMRREISEALSTAAPTALACFLHAADNAVDTEVAALFAGHPKSCILPLVGIRDHNVVPHLARHGGLGELLSWLVEGGEIPRFDPVPVKVDSQKPPLAPEAPRVSLFIGYLGPGGAERQIGYLAAEFAASGWEASLLAFSLRGDGAHFVEAFRSRGIPLTALDELPETPPWHVPFGWREVGRHALLLQRLPTEIRQDVLRAVKVFRETRPQLVVCYLDRVNIVGGIAALLAGVPRVLLSGRNLAPVHFPYLDRPWFPDMYRLLLKSPQVTLMANSQAGADSYREWLQLPAEAVPVVRNGLSPDALPENAQAAMALRRSLGVTDGAPLVLGVFRLSPEKRPGVFFDVMERLRAEHPNVKAVVAGLGNEFERCQSDLAASGRDEFIRLLGRREDVPMLIQAADLMLHVSEAEGVPNAIMEAQWLGCPVAGTLGGGTGEILTRAQRPYFHPVDDIDQVVRSALDLLNDPVLRHEVGDTSRREARQRFSTTTLLRETLDVARRRSHAPRALLAGVSPQAVARLWLRKAAAIAAGWWARQARRWRRKRRWAIVDIYHDERRCYRTAAPRGVISDEEGISPLILLENDIPLELGHAGHEDIRGLGRGRYSHWGHWLYFSSSDGSDPLTNGRAYAIVDETDYATGP